MTENGFKMMPSHPKHPLHTMKKEEEITKHKLQQLL